jgi:predicted metal-dependent hydrolase
MSDPYYPYTPNMQKKIALSLWTKSLKMLHAIHAFFKLWTKMVYQLFLQDDQMPNIDPYGVNTHHTKIPGSFFENSAREMLDILIEE